VSGAIGVAIILVVLWDAINRNQIIAGGIAGLIVGIAQWLVLRRYVRHAAWWIIANGIGWAVTGGGLMTGLGAGVVTGVMLLWLLHHTPQEAEQLREKATPSA
jgi:Na+(H+)/acetate symporter ActP